MARTTRTAHANVEPRISFNWGYHDGAADARQHRSAMWTSPHFDRFYEEGYVAGRNDARDGSYNECSTAAWEARS